MISGRAKSKHDIRVRRAHVITDDHVLARPDFRCLATEILKTSHNRIALHLRTRAFSGAQLYELASALLASAPGAALFINDRIDIAAAVGAAGVQLGVRSLPVAHARRILGPAAQLGYSAHSAEEAAAAERDGANFVLLGTIYRSASHPERTPAGPELIAETARRCTLPIIAIGGISLELVPTVLAAGASGVAVIRAVWDTADPVQAAAEFAKLT